MCPAPVRNTIDLPPPLIVPCNPSRPACFVIIGSSLVTPPMFVSAFTSKPASGGTAISILPTEVSNLMSPGTGAGMIAVIEPPEVSPESRPRMFSRLSAPPFVSTLVSPLKLRTAIEPPDVVAFRLPLPASDSILFVAGFPPFKAKRLKYYEHPVLSERAAMAPPKLRAERPYPYRPRPHPNPWLDRIIAADPTNATTPAAAPPKDASASTNSGGLSRGVSSETVREAPDAERLELADEADSEQHQELDTLNEDDAALRRQGLDDQENLRKRRDRLRPGIPL